VLATPFCLISEISPIPMSLQLACASADRQICQIANRLKSHNMLDQTDLVLTPHNHHPNVTGFSHVGHGTVCPVPSAGYSIACVQCGQLHLRKSIISTCAVIWRLVFCHVRSVSKTKDESIRTQLRFTLSKAQFGSFAVFLTFCVVSEIVQMNVSCASVAAFDRSRVWA